MSIESTRPAVVLVDQFGVPVTVEALSGRNVLSTHDSDLYRLFETAILQGLPADPTTQRPVTVQNDALPVKAANGALFPVIQQPAMSGPVVLAGLNAEFRIDLEGNQQIVFVVSNFTGTSSAAIEVSGDGGTTWQPVTFYLWVFATLLSATAIAGAGQFFATIAPFQMARVRVTAYTSGSFTVGAFATAGAQIVTLGASAAVIGAVFQQQTSGASGAGPFGAGSGSTIIPWLVAQKPSPLVVTNTATGAAVTVTLPAAGANVFHYITHITVSRSANAAVAAGAAPLQLTAANVAGSPWLDMNNLALVAGQTEARDMDFSSPIKSSVANTNTTFTFGAAVANEIFRITVWYYAE